MADSTPSPEEKKSQTNGWDALQNIMIAALNKGQFQVAIFGLIVLVMIYKLDGAQVYNLILKLFDFYKSLYYLGWGITFLVVPVSIIFIKRNRISYQNRLKRFQEHFELLEKENQDLKKRLPANKNK